MKSKKNKNLQKNLRKTKKGGFFFNRNKTIIPAETCNQNVINNIMNQKFDEEGKKIDRMDLLHKNYQTCCPKGWFGRKNSSDYCKNVDSTFQNLWNEENNANEYIGYTKEEEEQMRLNDPFAPSPPKKPFWKFWGGKTRKNKKCKYRRQKN